MGKVKPTPWRVVGQFETDPLPNFATTGDPNREGLPNWPLYSEKSDIALELGNEIKLRPELHKPELDFLDSYFQSLRTVIQ